MDIDVSLVHATPPRSQPLRLHTMPQPARGPPRSWGQGGRWGWEALGESIANVLNRAVQPVTPGTPSQGPLPALVAPDPRVDSHEGILVSLSQGFNSLTYTVGTPRSLGP